MAWNIFLFSTDTRFNIEFSQAAEEISFQKESINLNIDVDFESFKINLSTIGLKSVIHINMDHCDQCELDELVQSIRNDHKLHHNQLILWMNKPWINLDQSYLLNLGINDIRSTENLNSTRIKYIISVNLVNQNNIINIITLNENLEEKVIERTKLLTNSNKKLQVYVVENDNANTELQQQKKGT